MSAQITAREQGATQARSRRGYGNTSALYQGFLYYFHTLSFFAKTNLNFLWLVYFYLRCCLRVISFPPYNYTRFYRLLGLLRRVSIFALLEMDARLMFNLALIGSVNIINDFYLY